MTTMKHVLSLVLALFVVCAATTSEASYKQTFHVDTSFSSEEMAALESATVIWKHYTKGKVEISLVQDFGQDDDLAAWKGKHILAKITSDLLPEKAQEQTLGLCSRILGWHDGNNSNDGVRAQNHSNRPNYQVRPELGSCAESSPLLATLILIVSDNVRSYPTLTWVAVHELGHAIGLPHTASSNAAVMSPYYNSRLTWFTEEDRVLCNQLGVC